MQAHAADRMQGSETTLTHYTRQDTAHAGREAELMVSWFPHACRLYLQITILTSAKVQNAYKL